MLIFISYAAEDRSLADEIQLALKGAGHDVFFDKTSLPAGGDYHSRIRTAVERCDLFLFLISQNSVAPGSYALSELKFARIKWLHPQEHVLPVRLHETPWEVMPPYLKSVTILEPEGNIPAEIVAAISKINISSSVIQQPRGENIPHGSGSDSTGRIKEGTSAQIWIAIIGLISAIGVAVIANWHSLFPARVDAQYVHTAGMKGPDKGSPQPIGSDQKDALKAASDALASIRSGQYAKLWDTQTSKFMKSKVTKDSFFANMAMGRQQLGSPIGEPRFVDMAYSQGDTSTGFKAEIYAFNYLSSYLQGDYYERIVVGKDEDGIFRMVGLWGAPAPK
jgi:hypothetical protein